MTKVLGTIANERGKALVDHLITRITQEGLIIDRDVYIRPEGKLINTEDLGDVDILVIDSSKKRLYSIECKSMAPSRNIREMIGEIDKLFGDGTEEGWIDRHLKRHLWLEQNLSTVGEYYKVDPTGYAVRSFLVTEEAMLTPYLRKKSLPYPFVTRYDFDSRGKSVLDD